MNSIKFDISKSAHIFKSHCLQQLQPQISLAHKQLHENTGPGNEFLGWLNLPDNISTKEINRIKEAADSIRQKSEVLVVIGIGGSYLGARAVLELLKANSMFQSESLTNNGVQVIFAGQHMDSDYLKALTKWLEKKDFTINVISKSGTTTEPAIAFRILRQLMESKYGQEESKRRIYVTTDEKKGALKNLANEKGYKSFVIPDDIGGRYSVLTPVGLLPIASAGIDIEEMLEGARKACEDFRNSLMDNNASYQYAAYRNFLYQQGRTIEVLASYDPSFHYLCEWWKQLFGESEGKDGRGIFPASLQFTTDLHSMGQYVQDGRRILFETVLNIEKSHSEVLVPDTGENEDGLDYLKNKDLATINQKALEGTVMAHIDGGVPIGILTIPEKTPYWIGYVLYFFQKSCAISGYMLGVNPFDQPGVEDYKRNMFALLEKPGSESTRRELEAKWKK
ncbi:MAG: glucose-6-phosphate isomerase [Tindallia sp. MSAO_Bac2]|nr:MAG: glucose-6-phosphate isomerase [Tindallia sp. MSAO_Bac2]